MIHRLLPLAILLNCCWLRAEDGSELFVRRIQPLLMAKCFACHGGDQNDLRGGLDLSLRQNLQTGGDSQVALIDLDQPHTSPLLLAVMRQDTVWSPMPPKEADRLTDQQIDWVRRWLAQGAIWPDAENIARIRAANNARWQAEDGVTVETSPGLAANWNERRYAPDALWAYQPVVKPQMAATGSAAIDLLIARAMPSDVSIAAPASARPFIRRATFDLTGLPPTPQEIIEFEAAYARNADHAVEQLIERLLASPQYGERMAQHWLDVVRYADSSGFSNDYERGPAWRYRDYVIRAFDNDKPYDRFIEEQIAGDEIDAEDPELLVATGYLRMGPWELTGMEVAKVARQRFLDDVTNSIGETFLAQALQCARCHDHKFDPIPTRDYYALQSVFAATQLVDRPAAFLPQENIGGFDEARYLELARAEHQATLQRLDEKSLAAVDAWYAEKRLDPKKWKEAVEQLSSAAQPKQSQTAESETAPGAKAEQLRTAIPPSAVPPSLPFKRRGLFGAARALLLREGIPEDQFPPRMLGWTTTEIGMERIANKSLERINWQLDRYQPVALSVMNGAMPELTSVNAPLRMAQVQKSKAPIDSTHILIGGDLFSRGDVVRPGVLSVLASHPAKASTSPSLRPWNQTLPASLTGRRLALARWINHPSNALTTRSIVNRIWMWHFDQPIAGNPNNFGSTGKPPTHPELLDWLAATFVENHWSTKSLHRIIMNSAAYRRSCDVQAVTGRSREQLEQCHAVFKPRRLTAEEIRDSALACTGELNRAVGGIPVRPEINAEAAVQPRQVMGTFAAAWVPNPLPSQRHRRTLYALKLRGLVDPDQDVFNKPTADFSCERREVSKVSTQVFTLMHGQFSNARAVALADRLVKLKLPDADTVRQLWLTTLGRQPGERELKLCIDHWQQSSMLTGTPQLARSQVPTSIERSAVEENTGERFTYKETLYSNADFVPDLQWSDIDARTRGLAQLCLVLLNSNEYLYVY